MFTSKLSAGLLLTSIVLSSCGTFENISNQRDNEFLANNRDAADSELTPASDRSFVVVRNLVSTLRQVPELEPHLTAISVRKPQTRFSKLLVAELQETGYRIHLARGTDAPNLLNHTINRIASERGVRLYEFTLNINGVALKRTYELQRDAIFPASAMRIAGTDPVGIEVDDTLFDNQGAANGSATGTGRNSSEQRLPAPATQARVGSSEQLIEYHSDDRLQVNTTYQPSSAQLPVFAHQTLPLTADGIAGESAYTGNSAYSANATLVAGIAANQPAGAEADAAEEIPAKTPLAPLLNMYDLGKSNYSKMTGELDDVEKLVLVFEDDSLVLKRRNKQAAQKLVELFQPDTDVISVIGCSHGRSSAVGGNRALALGRASRVREELIMAGVNPAHILDEGCWAGKSFAKMPARAVLLTLKRRAPG